MRRSKDFFKGLALIMATLFGLLILVCGLLANENARLRMMLENIDEHAEFMWEGVVVAVAEDGATVYVIVDELGDEYVVEVDVYFEVIHTNIEVGDTAYFLVDNPNPDKWTDADLIAIEKRGGRNG